MLAHTDLVTGTMRGVIAGVLLLAFVAMWIWTFSPGRRAEFDSLARLPLEEDGPEGEQS